MASRLQRDDADDCRTCHHPRSVHVTRRPDDTHAVTGKPLPLCRTPRCRCFHFNDPQRLRIRTVGLIGPYRKDDFA